MLLFDLFKKWVVVGIAERFVALRLLDVLYVARFVMGISTSL